MPEEITRQAQNTQNLLNTEHKPTVKSSLFGIVNKYKYFGTVVINRRGARIPRGWTMSKVGT